MFPATACDHTTPSICTVGSASAVTVGGVAGSVGSVGRESARNASFGVAASDAVSASVQASASTRRRWEDCMGCHLSAKVIPL